MEGTAQIRIASRSVFGGVEDVIRMEGTATVEKTDYGWHLQYEAVNCEDEKSAIRSDVKVETATRRAILVNEGEGYGLLLDPAAVTATQIKTPPGQPHPERENQGGQLGPGQAKGWLGGFGVYAAGWHAACECAAGQPVSEKITGEKASFFLPRGL